MQAITVDGKSAASLKTIDTPRVGPGMILVKVQAVALNPTDWKHLDFFGNKDTTLGSDFVGTVVEKAPDAGDLVSVGDRVAGSVHGGAHVGFGAFAEYLVTYPAAVTAVPSSFQDLDAAGLGVGGFTALFGLFQPKHLGLPSPSTTSLPPVDPSLKVLVWSGATSVGQFAIQAARAAGAYVIATASPKNHEWLKSLGASETFDYADPQTPEAIAAQHPDLAHAFDTFSEKGSHEACARALTKNGPSKLVAILPFNPESVAAANAQVKPTFLLLYTTSGKETRMFGGVFDEAYCQEDKAYMAKMGSADRGLFYQLLNSGIVKPNRLMPQEGGLTKVLEGLDLLRHNKVSGQKLVYRFA
ncbi:Zinc-binding oxidoreductase alcohol dehydrogenase [Malassezia pachydermatis]